jgi:hypothetical protein
MLGPLREEAKLRKTEAQAFLLSLRNQSPVAAFSKDTGTILPRLPDTITSQFTNFNPTSPSFVKDFDRLVKQLELYIGADHKNRDSVLSRELLTLWHPDHVSSFEASARASDVVWDTLVQTIKQTFSKQGLHERNWLIFTRIENYPDKESAEQYLGRYRAAANGAGIDLTKQDTWQQGLHFLFSLPDSKPSFADIKHNRTILSLRASVKTLMQHNLQARHATDPTFDMLSYQHTFSEIEGFFILATRSNSYTRNYSSANIPFHKIEYYLSSGMAQPSNPGPSHTSDVAQRVPTPGRRRPAGESYNCAFHGGALHTGPCRDVRNPLHKNHAQYLRDQAATAAAAPSPTVPPQAKIPAPTAAGQARPPPPASSSRSASPADNTGPSSRSGTPERRSPRQSSPVDYRPQNINTGRRTGAPRNNNAMFVRTDPSAAALSPPGSWMRVGRFSQPDIFSPVQRARNYQQYMETKSSSWQPGPNPFGPLSADAAFSDDVDAAAYFSATSDTPAATSAKPSQPKH